MQSETGFPSSYQLKSYFASKSRLKLAARCPVTGCWPCYIFPSCNCHCVLDKLLKFRKDDFGNRGLYGSMYARILVR